MPEVVKWMYLARVLEGQLPFVRPVEASARRCWPIKGGGGAAIDVSEHVAIANAKLVLEVQLIEREDIRNRCKLLPA